MLPEEFIASLKHSSPPEGMNVYLSAMWHDENGNWNKSHSLIDQLEDVTACRLHAYLHRKEGDIWNADYWYKKAGTKRPDISLQQEWEMIVKTLL
jgi:hypothetical protein